MKIHFILLCALVCKSHLILGFVVMLTMLKSNNKLRYQKAKNAVPEAEKPSIGLVIFSKNQHEKLSQKMKEIQKIRYRQHKLKVYFVTDGSIDGSQYFLRTHTDYKVLHSPTTQHKKESLKRVLEKVQEEILIFSDASVTLTPNILLSLCKTLKDTKSKALAFIKKRALSEDQNLFSQRYHTLSFENEDVFESEYFKTTIFENSEVFAYRNFAHASK